MQVASLNCGRQCGPENGAEIAVRALLTAIEEKIRLWDVLFLQELDNMHVVTEEYTEKLRASLSPHVWVREFGGVGNTPFACIVNRR